MQMKIFRMSTGRRLNNEHRLPDGSVATIAEEVAAQLEAVQGAQQPCLFRPIEEPAPGYVVSGSICDSPQLKAPLENLPPEIRAQLLFILELEELTALVHASSVFHQPYLLDRRSLLCKSLETTLRSVTVDASAAYRTSSAGFSDTRTSEKVTQFLKSY
jgi:hypothetical protein